MYWNFGATVTLVTAGGLTLTWDVLKYLIGQPTDDLIID